MKKFLTLLITVFTLFLTACSPNLSSNTLNPNEVGAASKVLPGVIYSKRAVAINNNSGVGGAAGLTAGAAAGSTIGGDTATNIVGAVGGALVGGLLGNAIDKSIHSETGYEYIVKLSKGNMISVIQTQDTNLFVGQRVLVIYGPRTRLVPNNS